MPVVALLVPLKPLGHVDCLKYVDRMHNGSSLAVAVKEISVGLLVKVL